jgi:site-specific DNA-cytosine methylase
MNVLDLFSGIGGFSLGLQRAGFTTVQFVEIDPFCQKVLNKNFPGVPIHDDIKTFHWPIADTGCLRQEISKEQTAGIEQCAEATTYTESEQTHATEQRGLYAESCGEDRTRIDLICGGFPCQPFSCAGKRKGTEDDRFLWPEMLRVISEVQPAWVIAENVGGLYSQQDGMVFGQVLSDLEAQGYEVQPFLIPACAVNAPHRRDRWWFIANRTKQGLLEPRLAGIGELSEETREGMDNRFKQQDSHVADTDRLNGDNGRYGSGKISQFKETEICGCDHNNVADTEGQGLEGRNAEGPLCPGGWNTKYINGGIGDNETNPWNKPWLEVATRLCGIFNGLSEWMDRSGGLKNAKISDSITGQDLPCLWEGFQSESFQWSFGRFNTVQDKENVFTVLWEHFRQSYRQDDLPFESATVQEAFLRNVWISERSGCSPQRWEYNEQYTREHSDALSSLSHEIALETKELTDRYNKDRVNRLKALGNAIVPQIVTILGQAIMNIERKNGKL